eukprot:c38900_g1_i1.p1 GENE.c38900_g1_i1~~c38900_g1_i1.p1  ORF type:complete len:125 (-),score=20.36 c38900_g1_i1:197-571(-)
MLESSLIVFPLGQISVVLFGVLENFIQQTINKKTKTCFGQKKQPRHYSKQKKIKLRRTKQDFFSFYFRTKCYVFFVEFFSQIFASGGSRRGSYPGLFFAQIAEGIGALGLFGRTSRLADRSNTK